ncbi:MAG TPA: ATP-binding protein, partial [Gemmatimonadales bacterium]|nr:ATP-binding protein [Gemmatimonadales bacterium]
APSGLAIVDREGRVARGNLTLARLTGVPLQGLPGCALPALFPEWPAGDADPLARAREGATSSRLIAGPGGRMLVLTLAPERAGRIVAVVDDITREQEAHEALRRSEARFRALLEAAPVAILTIERTGTVEAVNATAQALVGLPDVPRAFLADLVVPGDRSFLAGQCQQAFGGARRECTVHFRRPDGTVREVALVLVPIEERGGVRTVLGIARDVTDERALQERVAHAEKMAALGQLVSGVAHELNNPLAGITALAEALALDVQDEGTERVLETIRREAARAARIVQDLLLFSHQRPLVRRAVDLPALLREAVAAPGVDPARWELVAEGEVPPADADPDQLLQVLRNLVRNADQAMAGRPGARGRLRAWAEGDRVACEVADEGPGIAPDVLNRIFEPFFTTKPAGEGTGLGLSISHGIIRAHGGEIRAQNRPTGGARFWFELPRAIPPRPR